jgi:hypothetical protein
MATAFFDEGSRDHNEQIQGSMTAQGMKTSETDQKVDSSPQDRSHSASVMDTDKA